jgi:hypothetical protein
VAARVGFGKWLCAGLCASVGGNPQLARAVAVKFGRAVVLPLDKVGAVIAKHGFCPSLS